MAYILIADDDEDFASAVARVLGNAGHETRIELTTEQAMAAMRERPPDLAILDVMFPENSAAGFDLARAMRLESGALKQVPILMLTAVNQAFPLGFGPSDIDDTWLPITDFLEKPVDLDLLTTRVASLLGDKA